MNIRFAILCLIVVVAPAMAWQGGQSAAPPMPRQASSAAGMATPSPYHSEGDEATRPNTPEDARLVTTIHQAIDRDPGMAGGSRSITPIVSEGAVVLRGDVASEVEKARIDSIVRQLPGVTEVTNELDVKP